MTASTSHPVSATCPVTYFQPDAPGSYPGVVFLQDGIGPRPALFEMAQRIARAGYVVGLPDLFHRVGSVLDLTPPGQPREFKPLMARVFSDPELRARWRERYFASASNPENLARDVEAVLAGFAARSDVRPAPFGVVGYCLGGNLALRVAALFGDRIAAAASFHGGSLATDAPDSPHLGAPAMRARLLICAAMEDPSLPADMQQRLAAALREAAVVHSIETYPARHGFCVPDAPTFDAAAAERHYSALTEFFAQTLGH